MRGKWKWRAALCGITLAAYANSFHLGLAFDAKAIVTGDRRIHELTTENLGLIFQKDYWWPVSSDRLYRPVTMLSYLVNYAILGSGESPAGYHSTNFLLHLANVWMFFELALWMLGGAEAAFLAAALWAVHPVGTECVTNVAGRADLLCAAGLLGALLLYVRGSRWVFAAALFATFSKEMGAVLVALMLLWDLSFGAGGWRAEWRKRAPAYAAALAALALLLWARDRVFHSLPWPEQSFIANPIVAAGFWAGRFTAVKVIGMYLGLLVFPWRLSSDHSYNQIPVAGWTDALAWASLVAVASILVAVLVRYRRDRLMFWAAGFTGILLLPTANLFFPIGTILAERFLYLPSAAFAIAVVALALRWKASRRRTQAALGLLIGVFVCRTWARNPAWDDDLTLAQADTQSAPGSAWLHQIVAAALFERDPRGNIDRAIEEAEKAWNILQPLPADWIFQRVPTNLGAYYRYKGDLVGGPTTAEGRVWYGRALATLQRACEVAQAVEKSFDRQQLAHGRPLGKRIAMANAFLNLGAVEAILGRYGEALAAYRYGRDLDPASTDPYDEISAVYLGLGNAKWAGIVRLEKSMLEGQPAPADSGDLCAAWQDLAQAFDAARQPERAAEFRAKAAGCRTP